MRAGGYAELDTVAIASVLSELASIPALIAMTLPLSI